MLHVPAGSTGSVEIDVADLDSDEWFLVITMQGERPDADFTKVQEYRDLRARLTPAEQQMRLRVGLEKLMSRGYIDYDRDESGRILTQKDAAGVDQPIYKTVGRLVQRVSEFDPHKFLS